MSGISGTETIKKIKQIHSDTKFIMISGNMAAIKLTKEEKKEIPIVMKPFGSEDIVDIVRTMIELTDNKNEN